MSNRDNLPRSPSARSRRVEDPPAFEGRGEGASPRQNPTTTTTPQNTLKDPTSDEILSHLNSKQLAAITRRCEFTSRRYNAGSTMMSTGPDKANCILEYQQPRRRTSVSWPWVLLLLAPLPFGIEVVLIFHLATEGDPIGNVGLFRAYHYWTSATLVIVLTWLVWVAITFRRSHPWVVLIAVGWCVWVCWVGFWFLREVHNDQPPGMSWSVWR
jgi:hypothetical protein